MADSFLSEIRIMPFAFAASGWAMCNGQLLPIHQNQALFLLLGTTFGGDGEVNFALPDLRGRAPMHAGNGHTLGELGGEQAHTLTIAELPPHPHSFSASSLSGNSSLPNSPSGNLLARSANPIYGSPHNLATMNPASITYAGGGQAHQNMQPFLPLNFCIALQGLFPSPA